MAAGVYLYVRSELTWPGRRPLRLGPLEIIITPLLFSFDEFPGNHVDQKHMVFVRSAQ